MRIGMKLLIIGLYSITTILDLILFLFDPRAFHLAALGGVSGLCVITILYRKPWSYWLLNASAPLHFLFGGTTLFATFRIYGLILNPSTLVLYLGLGSYTLLFLYLNFFLYVNRKNINLSVLEVN